MGGQRQPGHRERLLEREQEPGTARGQDGQVRAGREQPFDDDADSVEQVLAVVEHEQGGARAEPAPHDVLDRAALALTQPQRECHGEADRARVGDADEVDEPDAVGVADRDVARDPHGQACLADTTRADGRDETVLTERGGEGGPLGPAADERGQGGRDRGVARGADGPFHRSDREQLAGRVRELAPVGELQLAQQGGHVALHGPHGDEQPLGDLGVGQVVRHGGQHLRLARRHSPVRDRPGGGGRRCSHGVIVPLRPDTRPFRVAVDGFPRAGV